MQKRLIAKFKNVIPQCTNSCRFTPRNKLENHSNKRVQTPHCIH